jgi:hypothetical protein
VSRALAVRCTLRSAEAGSVASVGSTGDSHGKALAEAFDSLDRAEPVRSTGPWESTDDLEIVAAGRSALTVVLSVRPDDVPPKLHCGAGADRRRGGVQDEAEECLPPGLARPRAVRWRGGLGRGRSTMS